MPHVPSLTAPYWDALLTKPYVEADQSKRDEKRNTTSTNVEGRSKEASPLLEGSSGNSPHVEAAPQRDDDSN
jgi:hypothetical protein